MRGPALLLLTALCTAASADPLDAELARGTMRATGPAARVAFVLDAEPTPALLALIARYNVPVTLFVPSGYWDAPRDHDELALLKRAEISIGLRIERGDDIAATLERAERAGFAIGTFITRRRLATMMTDAKRAGLTEVTWSLALTRANRGVLRFAPGAIVRVAPEALAAVLDEVEAMNCSGSAPARSITTPVSLHYFVHDRGRARAVPDHVQERTAAYIHSLADRCEDRAHDRAPGDYPARKRAPDLNCLDNPLAKGCY
ncbi:MAG: hypothetical protein SFX73_00945 [Kofleriaceae bacterium]|nr:hypothetical protein [Kofleriaceae bacterium]